MKKRLHFSFLFIFLLYNSLLLADGSLRFPPSSVDDSRINFGSRNSALKFSSGSTLQVTSADSKMTIDGTLVKDHDANIQGNKISFQKGILESGGSQAYMTATFNPTDPDSIWLEGNAFFDAEPGIVIQNMYVDGNNNRLEGQALFNNAIQFFDSDTTLTIALQSSLNQSIILNGGMLRLANDLKLSDNVFLVGPGTIRLNNRQAALGAFYSSPWSTPLTWDHATDVVLTGRTDLSNEWIFFGECRLNGNGNVLDLSSGGTIYVSPGSTLHMTDVQLRGIGNQNNDPLMFNKWGHIVFGDENSQINTYNVDIELENNFDTTVGKIYVEGPTTFILKQWDWTFSYNSLLTVDGVTLWLDTVDVRDWPYPGQLNAPLPLYTGHYWNHGYLTYDLAHNLDLIKRGTVREVTDRSQTTFSSISTALTSGTLTTSLSLDQSVHIHPHQRINIGNNIVIDGNGATLVFSNPDHAQFIVRDGWTVTLRNIELDRINQDTFDLRYVRQSKAVTGSIVEGKILIGENVVFGLSENVTFSQGLIELLNHSVTGEAQVFQIRGVDGKKRLVFNPTQEYKNTIVKDIGVTLPDASRVASAGANTNYPILLKMNENTLGIHAINMTGFHHISKTTGSVYTGAIGLQGDADLDIGNPTWKYSGIEESAKKEGETYDMAFVVEGIDNRFRLLKDALKLTGQLLFADEGENVLHIDSLLTERLDPAPIDDSTRRIPLIRFGAEFLDLTSFSGMARLIFDDTAIRLKNDANAFVAFENSFLGGHRIEVTGDPIWDFYDPASAGKPFVLEVDQLIGLDDISNNPIVSEFANLSYRIFSPFELLRSRHKYSTALHLKYQKERERFGKPSPANAPQPVAQPKPTPQPKPAHTTRPRPRPSRSEMGQDYKTISLPPATEKVVDYKNLTNIDLSSAKGNIKLLRTYAVKVSIGDAEALNLTLDTNSTVELRTDEDVTLKSGDIINVVGKGNEIRVTKTLTMNGDIYFDTDSQLKLILEGDDAVVSFAANSILDLESNCELLIEGTGSVVFGDGSVINLKGLTTNQAAKPLFHIRKGAIVSPSSSASIQFKGVGKIWVDDGARLDVVATTADTSILVGHSDLDDTVDDIDIKVVGTGMLRLEGSGNNTAKMSIIKAAATLNVYQSGILAIQNKGLLEINNLDGVLTRAGQADKNTYQGNFKSMVLGPFGIMFLHEGGKLAIADNYDKDNRTMIFKSSKAFIDGNGNVEYVRRQPFIGHQYQGFAGQLQGIFTQVLFDETSITVENLVRRLVNENSALSTATQLTNLVGTKVIRLKNGRQINIATGDTLTGEDSSGNVIGTNSAGSRVTYNLDGTRVVS